jgi:hypothetical protein
MSMLPKFKESTEQIDYAASIGGIGNFFVNSAINGLLNSTLKAGLQAESVQQSLRNGKLTGKLFPKSQFTFTSTADRVNVGTTMSMPKMIWGAAKEPIGEFSEEYLQTISDSFFSGFADHNINTFIDNKYNGDAMATVGETFAGDWAAAWTELTNSLVSKESLKAGLYGALGSIIGSPKIGGFKSVDGKIGRGKNLNGENESTLDMITRLTPWRSGLISGIRQVRRERDVLTQQAKALEDWINNPENKSKFNSLIGSLSWMQEIHNSSNAGNEFNYRNSTLGKAINDIFMLQKLEGSDFYDSLMKQVTDIAYMSEDSEQAAKLVEELRKDVNNNSKDLSDKEIFKNATDNAKKTLSLMSSIKEESDKIDKLLGVTDEDVKQSLIYAQLSIDDWNKRSKQLQEELSNIDVKTERQASQSLTESQKKAIANYGSLAKAREAIAKFEKRQEDLKKFIQELEDRKKYLSKPEQELLKKFKAESKSIKSKVKELDSIAELPIDVTDNVLNEVEIMALDPISRSQMILQGKAVMYAKLYGVPEEQINTLSKSPFSEAQQRVIDDLVNKGMSQDKDFLAKIVDLGKVESAKNKFLKQYNQVLLSPEGLTRYSIEAKAQAKDAIAQKRAEEINAIEDYKEFAKTLDNVLKTTDVRASRVLFKTLKDNDNYARWKEQHDTVERLIKTISENRSFQKLDGNTKDLFAISLGYLYENGVDLNNESEVLEALQAIDEKGYNKFISYLNTQNADREENDQVRFTKLEEVFQTYKDILNQAQYDKAVQEHISKPKENDSTVVTPSPTPAPSPATEEEKEVKEKVEEEIKTTPTDNEYKTPLQTVIEEEQEKPKDEETEKNNISEQYQSLINLFQTQPENIQDIISKIVSR